MQGDLTDTKRKQYLLAILIILVVIVMGLVFVIGSYPYFLAPEPTKTGTITNTIRATQTATNTTTITPTATVTKTSRPTFSPTFTLTPSITSTPAPSATPTGLPTLTPALPLGNNLVYTLSGWKPENADYLIKLMEGYPDTLPESERGEDNADYYGSFEYTLIALSDALFRFPGSVFVEDWNWHYAFNLARIGDTEAGESYAKIIRDGLNTDSVTVQKLKSWFKASEPRLDISLVKIDPIPGVLNSYIAEIRGGGGAYIWLLETEEGFKTIVLETIFDFTKQPQVIWILEDLNNNLQDGKEIVIYSSNKPGDYAIQPPEVLNISRPVPGELQFIPEKDLFNIGMDFVNHWSVSKTAADQNQLLFQTRVYPVCPVTIKRSYLWNGTFFDNTTEDYRVEPLPGALFFCEYILDHAERIWGPQAAVKIMETILPAWPPQVDADKKPYPLDALDGLLYRLALNHALAGNSKEAKDYLSQLINNPSIPNSRWVEPARQFLNSYKLPDDIYNACISTPECIPSYALEYLVENIPSEKLDNPVQTLLDLGVNITSSGYFDFEGDNQEERWITVKHRPTTQLEYWILADSQSGKKAIRVGAVDANPPITELLDEGFVSEDYDHLKNVVFVDKKYAFIMKRIPDRWEPYIEFIPLRAEYPSHFQNGMDIAEEYLFEKNDPLQARIELLNLEDWPGLHCEVTWSCDRYYYMLGLASELSGYERESIDVYLKLWRLYPESPFTTMARVKLAGPGMQPSPIPAVALTATPTASSSIIPTGTASPTVSSTPTVLMTLTETPTVTNTAGAEG
ncbi:MAG: hypothetical protein ACK2U3_02075 [Anaerolineales bacterium]